MLSNSAPFIYRTFKTGELPRSLVQSDKNSIIQRRMSGKSVSIMAIINETHGEYKQKVNG